MITSLKILLFLSFSLILLIYLFAAANTFAQQPQWRLASGTEGVYISEIDIYDSNPDTLYATGQQFLISIDKGEHWDSVSGAPRFSVIEIDPFDSKRIYLNHGMLPTDGTELLMSTDGGISWESLFVGFGKPQDYPIVEIDPGDINTVYVDITPNRFYRSSDHGNTWDSIPSPDVYGGLSSLAIAPSNNNILYAGYTWPIKIYKSTDRSQSWTQLPFPLINYYESLIFIAVHPKNPGIVYAAISAGESRGVYKTMDGGQTWNQMNNGLDSLQGYDWINTIVINPKVPETLYLGASNSPPQNPALFRSIDGANSWLPFDDGLPEYAGVSSIAIDTLNERIYMGSGGGIYIYDSLTTSIDTKTLQTPKEFLLYQNFPNPFNSSTIITYTLAEKSFVNLTVYDVLGGEVASLVKENKPSGKHSVEFNASNLPSGIYFYRIVSGNFIATKKLILLK